MSALGPGCVKTRNRPLEIVFKLGIFWVEVNRLLTGRYRLVSRSIASHVVFESDFWGAIVSEFSHSLGRKRTVILLIIERFEWPLWVKADVQPGFLKITLPSVWFTPGSSRSSDNMVNDCY